MDEKELRKIHKTSIYHRKIIEQKNLCGCFHCCNTFKPTDIKKWTDTEDTALCPKCEIDSIIPLNATEDNAKILKEMFEYWFDIYYESKKLLNK